MLLCPACSWSPLLDPRSERQGLLCASALLTSLTNQSSEDRVKARETLSRRPRCVQEGCGGLTLCPVDAAGKGQRSEGAVHPSTLALGTPGLRPWHPPSGWSSSKGQCHPSAPQAHFPFLSVAEAHSSNLPKCLTSSRHPPRINPLASLGSSCSQEPTVAPQGLMGINHTLPIPLSLPLPCSQVIPTPPATACPQESTVHPAGEHAVLSSRPCHRGLATLSLGAAPSLRGGQEHQQESQTPAQPRATIPSLLASPTGSAK